MPNIDEPIRRSPERETAPLNDQSHSRVKQQPNHGVAWSNRRLKP